MGSNLFPKEAIAAKDWGKIQQMCEMTFEIIKKTGYQH